MLLFSGQNADGAYEGVHAFIGAQSIVGQTPRILIAPGFTHKRDTGVELIDVTHVGSGYTKATVKIEGNAKATASVSNGEVRNITVDESGSGYEKAPRITIEGDGKGATATATIKQMSNPVAAELIGIAERLRAIVVVDGPNTTDEEAIEAAKDFGSKRVVMVDPFASVLRKGKISQEPASSLATDVIAKIDFTHNLWYSPSHTHKNTPFILSQKSPLKNYIFSGRKK